MTIKKACKNTNKSHFVQHKIVGIDHHDTMIEKSKSEIIKEFEALGYLGELDIETTMTDLAGYRSVVYDKKYFTYNQARKWIEANLNTTF